MAYYAALISSIHSLEKISNRDKYPKFLLDKQHFASIYEKLSHLKAILEDYSPKDREAADCLERRIRDAAYQVRDILEHQDIIEYKISNLIPSKVKTVVPRILISKLKRAMSRQLQDIEMEEIDSIEMTMKEEIGKTHGVRMVVLRLLISKLKRAMSRQLQDTEKEETDSIETTMKEEIGKTHGVRMVVLRLLISKLKRATLLQLQYIEKAKEEIDRTHMIKMMFPFHLIKLKRATLRQLQDIEKAKEEIGKTHRVRTVVPRVLISKSKRAMPRQLQDLEKAKEEIDSIVEEVMRMKIKKSHTTQDLKLINYSSTSEQEPVSTSCRDTVVGFEERLTTIKDQLCGASSKLEVVPLVGMGGIGKTTLARSIFYDRLIVHHFDRRAWVTVSQDYHLKKILLDILYSMKVDTEKLSGVEEEELVVRIYRYMKERRYLIIMDDMWDTKVWDAVRRIFPDDNNGSRIIITTRLLDVAVYANSRASVHQMQFLNEDQSWDLLREKVFGQENCPRELEDIGRFIARNCRGLPLAIVVVAGILSKVTKARYWEKIARNVSSVSIGKDEHFSKIFSLSYNQLPHHLKPCFLFMGGFPEDYKITVSRLIKLWVAEGFLKSSDESKSLEEMGEEYLEDLVKRNLILITKKKTNGKFKYCSIHDVLRDLCMKRAHYDSFLHIHTKGTRNTIRRLFIHPACSQLKTEEFCSHVGSILCFCDDKKLLSFASCFKLLRVLDALQVRFYSFPVAVLELCCLRFLALGLGETRKFNIPPEIIKLENLQTLILRLARFYPKMEFSFPFQIWKMPNLRHVNVYRLQLSRPIPFACILENLQSLSMVNNFKFTNRAIQTIPNLKKLEVSYSDYDYDNLWEKFCLYNLVQLHQLETLDISFLIDRERTPQSHELRINFQSHENLFFPRNLKKLSLSGCYIPWKNMTAVGSLPNLEVLKLRHDSFVGDEWEPKEGEFPRLKFLLMSGLDLRCWRAEHTHFPRLEHLKIVFCFELKEIPLGIGDIPTLKLIEVQGSDFAADSAVQIQNEQRDMGNDDLQVHVSTAFRYWLP